MKRPDRSRDLYSDQSTCGNSTDVDCFHKTNNVTAGNSLTGSDRSSMGGYLRPATAVVRPMNQEALDMLEYPFITMQQYPPGFILHLGKPTHNHRRS